MFLSFSSTLSYSENNYNIRCTKVYIDYFYIIRCLNKDFGANHLSNKHTLNENSFGIANKMEDLGNQLNLIKTK